MSGFPPSPLDGFPLSCGGRGYDPGQLCCVVGLSKLLLEEAGRLVLPWMVEMKEPPKHGGLTSEVVTS